MKQKGEWLAKKVDEGGMEEGQVNGALCLSLRGLEGRSSKGDVGVCFALALEVIESGYLSSNLKPEVSVSM